MTIERAFSDADYNTNNKITVAGVAIHVYVAGAQLPLIYIYGYRAIISVLKYIGRGR